MYIYVDYARCLARSNVEYTTYMSSHSIDRAQRTVYGIQPCGIYARYIGYSNIV